MCHCLLESGEVCCEARYHYTIIRNVQNVLLRSCRHRPTDDDSNFAAENGNILYVDNDIINYNRL